MRLVVQRVNKAKVIRVIDQKVTGETGLGLFVLIGFRKGDSEKDAEIMAEKISKLRIMSDDKDKINLSVLDTKSEILVVSQFTLYANTNGGNRPSFIDAEEPAKAKGLYEFFIEKLKEKGIKVETGSFGDYMKIEAELDGPVTIIYSE